jgi:hypothetical protein
VARLTLRLAATSLMVVSGSASNFRAWQIYCAVNLDEALSMPDGRALSPRSISIGSKLKFHREANLRKLSTTAKLQSE